MIKICRNGQKGSRAQNVYLNSGIALSGQILQILAGFIVRRMFLLYLGKSFLGYESVFSNILQMLNTADMGISVAVTAFLYEPLSKRDDNAVAALMYLYKRIYQVIGAVVLVFGVGISFLLPILVPDADCSFAMLRVYFFVSLSGTIFTYYLAYKRTLLLADQKSYLVMLVDTIVYLAASLCQIVILHWWPSYLLYLLTVAARILISNAIIAFGCSKLYPNLRQSVNKTDYELYKTRVTTYVKDLFIAKIGGYVFNSTDNLVLSIFRGSVLAGYLSNYTMVTQQVNNLVGQILSSVQATYGNFITETKDIEKQRKMTDSYLMVNAFIGTFCMLCVMFMIQPFVQLFFGKGYLLKNSTVLWLSMNLMLSIILQLPTQIFTVYRLYHYDRPIVAISAGLNIVISALLVQNIGIDGVLIGTFITSLIYLFSRFYIIAIRVYHIPFWHYLVKFLKYFSIAAVCVIMMYKVTSKTMSATFMAMAVKAIVSGLLAAILPLCVLNLTSEFRHITEIMVPQKWKICCSKWVIWGAAIILLTVMEIGGRFGAPKKQAGEGNKSVERTDTYVLENQETSEKVFHLSFDDVIDVFRDLTINEDNYNSLFENDTFGWLKEMHEKYGIVVSCFVYYQDGDFCLEDCTTKFKGEFEENSDWLRFGFHSLTPETMGGEDSSSNLSEDYRKTIRCLENIVGKKSETSTVRLHYYSATKAEVQALIEDQELPLTGLFCADDSRPSYYLNEEQNEYIYCHDEYIDSENGLRLISTDIRIEYIDDIDKKTEEFLTNTWNNQLGYLVAFTHEWALDEEGKEKIDKLCAYAKKEGYQFSFFEDTGR